MDDKRRGPRQRVSFKVTWDDGERFYGSALTNISETGVFVETALPLPVGKVVHVIPLLEDDDTHLVIQGLVVRAEDGRGMAIEFAPLTDAQRQALARALQS